MGYRFEGDYKKEDLEVLKAIYLEQRIPTGQLLSLDELSKNISSIEIPKILKRLEESDILERRSRITLRDDTLVRGKQIYLNPGECIEDYITMQVTVYGIKEEKLDDVQKMLTDQE